MTLQKGDRVWVSDPGLAQLRALMRSFGENPAPNHTGTVSDDQYHDGVVMIDFDGGGAAPYPLDMIHLLDGEPPS